MINRLVDLLEQEIQDLTAEEIADILWLTLQQWQLPTNLGSSTTQKGILPPETVKPLIPSIPPQIPADGSKSGTSSSNSTHNDQEAGITTRSSQKSSESDSAENLGAPLAIPDAPSLRNSLDILKALRPLIRLIPSAQEAVLDVPATVKGIAETELWLIKLRPLLEPWLELALVVDATPSMIIWQRTISNLRRVLSQSGVFRDVRLWSLETIDEESENTNTLRSQQLCLRPGFGTTTSRQSPCRPQELIDPNGRRLILLVSDCIDARWDAQPIRDLLQVWSERGPIGLVQVLPEWLWSRTALNQVTKGQVVGLIPGQPSQALTFIRRDLWRTDTPVGVRVPVMTLEPAVTHRWSQMVAGQSSVMAPGLVFSPVKIGQLSTNPELAPQVATQSAVEPTPEERVAQFRTFSSSLARRLAGLLAACPEINLPVIRMVQAALLNDAQQVHVAEVLLGGLFKPQTEISADTVADQIQYVFHEGVRPLVQATISPRQAFSSLSAWVKRRFGYALEDFPAYLTTTQGEEVKPFAGVMLEVLNRQGRQYVGLTEQIRKLSGKLAWSDFPELETLSFTTAQLREPTTTDPAWPPPLQTEEYTVATITLIISLPLPLEPFKFKVGHLVTLGNGWVVQKSNGEAQRYIEQLNETTILEMVKIPAGSFKMGSSKQESGADYSKETKHLVALPEFYMGRYPVTQAQWRSVAALPQVELALNPDPSNFKGANHPVEQVSWDEAIEFCVRLSKHTQRQYRLPTEAEWEYACRAGTTTPFHFGETISPELANYNSRTAYGNEPIGENREITTTPVNYFEVANAWGLCDMHGNVWEWCQDHWHENYRGAPADGSAWLIDTENLDFRRVTRGGSWNNNPRECRSAFRCCSYPTDRYSLGLRVAYSPPIGLRPTAG